MWENCANPGAILSYTLMFSKQKHFEDWILSWTMGGSGKGQKGQKRVILNKKLRICLPQFWLPFLKDGFFQLSKGAEGT